MGRKATLTVLYDTHHDSCQPQEPPDTEHPHADGSNYEGSDPCTFPAKADRHHMAKETDCRHHAAHNAERYSCLDDHRWLPFEYPIYLSLDGKVARSADGSQAGLRHTLIQTSLQHLQHQTRSQEGVKGNVRERGEG